MIKPELLAPAGNLTKLKTAFYFGADAVYAGGKDFSLRSFAGNFSDGELKEGVDYAHALGKKVYAAVNIFARNEDLKRVESYLNFLEDISADGVILTDPGLIRLAGKTLKKTPVHLSTQANTLNRAAVSFWAEQGIKRVILARELSLNEISEIREEIPAGVELEAFVHGAMCISYSGRCLLSNYLSSRDSNRGECVQACRWNYAIKETGKGEGWLDFQEDERGSYILNSKDLNMIEHLDKLAEAGICSFKIEGRMKSEYYIACVVNAYRQAIDFFSKNKGAKLPNEISGELYNTAHREFTTAYMLDKNDSTVNYEDSSSKGAYEFIAVVLSYSGGLAEAEMRNRFKRGDVLEVLTPNHAPKAFTVDSIWGKDGVTDDAKNVQERLRLEVPFPVHEGDILRRKV